MKKTLFVPLLIVLALVLAACGTEATPEPTAEAPAAEQPAVEQPANEPIDEEMAVEPEDEMPGTIVDIAVADERFTTLVTALQAAELVEALQGEGPFTVFAPTNDAFDALPEGALDGLLADISALTNVLLYHVVDGKVMAADVIGLDGQDVATLFGQTLAIAVTDAGVTINGINVIITDLEADNGVIHVIDAVLLP